MKKLFGVILAWLLIAIGIILVLPTALGIVCFWTVLNLICWANGEHTYDPKQILNGTTIKFMRCTKCYKLISPKEEAGVQTQIDLFIAGLKQSREFLNDVFATPEERAVENLIKETQN